MTGDDLRAYRRRHGLSQAALASLLGVPQNTISRWELGTIKLEHPRVLELALQALASNRRDAAQAADLGDIRGDTHVPY